MSHFDLPRINFHGTALLDTATANNGNYESAGLTMFDQDESEPFLPPRCYLSQPFEPILDPDIQVFQDKSGRSYVPLSAITVDNYQTWASTPLGSFSQDKAYWDLYNKLGLTGKTPGYWNYFGDLSFSLNNVTVTGVSVYQPGVGVVHNTPEEQPYCPPFLQDMFGAQLSFNNNYFSPGSRTSAYLSDVDSIGQMCTQVFIGQAGLYKKGKNDEPITLFSGSPVKSTARWMNLQKVLNYADHHLLPMGGSASFYAKVELENGDSLLSDLEQLTGVKPDGLMLKFMIHEVHEIREPDYSQITTQSVNDIQGNSSDIKKNPATCGISGSITPWYKEDMTTASISRLMKNDDPVAIETKDIPTPQTKGQGDLSVPSSVNLAPIQFVHDPKKNLVSLDIMNAINEYGLDPGSLPPYAGDGDVLPFQNFESYNYGALTLMYQPDKGGAPLVIGSLGFDSDYNMRRLLESGGVVDFNVAQDGNFSDGYFFILGNGKIYFKEYDYFITSDQMGNYAQQNQEGNNYMSDGLPKSNCVLRVFHRGAPLTGKSYDVTKQTLDLRSGNIVNAFNFGVYDGLTLDFEVNKDGCLTYGYIDGESTIWDGTMPTFFKYIMNTSLIVVRTLSDEPQLADYLSGKLPLTWKVVFDNVFSLYKTLYPIMDKVVPFTEANWSDPFLLQTMKNLMAEENWNQPLYMPVTRDLSDAQRNLLQMWVDQISNSK